MTMFEISILSILLIVINIILVIGFVSIFFLILKFGKQYPMISKDPNFLPRVSIVIPTCNEETVIGKRLDNLISMDYPSELLEIIFVDKSEDKTRSIIKKYQKDHSYIKLLIQEKPGFNNALNQGYSAATGEIVIKSDCDAFPQSDALRKIVSNFADDTVGAVSGIYYFDSNNKEEMESLFRDVQTRFKQTEAYFHSSLISHGGFGAYRKHLIPKLPEEITADDIELVINVVKKGYRAIIDPAVKIRNPSPEMFSERRKQMDRRAAGVIRVIMNNVRMLFNPHFGKFGLIAFPIEFFTLVAAPILLLVDLILLAALAFSQPVVAIGLLLVIGLFGISIFFSNISRMVLDTYISLLHGIVTSFTKKKTWAKETDESRKKLVETMEIS